MKKNNAGFSLMEVMVAGALLAGLGLVLAKFGQDANKTAKTAETSIELNQMFSEISTVLSDSGNCKESIQGPLGQPVTVIKRKMGTEYVESFAVNKKYGNGTLEIKSMKAVDEPTGTKLVIEVQKIGQVAGGKFLIKKVPIVATIASGVITGCGASSGSGVGPTIPIYQRPDGTLTLSGATASFDQSCEYCSGAVSTVCTPEVCPPGFEDKGLTNVPKAGPPGANNCGPSGAHRRISTRSCKSEVTEIGRMLAK